MILEIGASRFGQGEAVMPDVQARQRLARSAVAGATGQYGVTVRTIHTVFARGVSPSAALASLAPAR